MMDDEDETIDDETRISNWKNVETMFDLLIFISFTLRVWHFRNTHQYSTTKKMRKTSTFPTFEGTCSTNKILCLIILNSKIDVQNKDSKKNISLWGCDRLSNRKSVEATIDLLIFISFILPVKEDPIILYFSSEFVKLRKNFSSGRVLRVNEKKCVPQPYWSLLWAFGWSFGKECLCVWSNQYFLKFVQVL